MLSESDQKKLPIGFKSNVFLKNYENTKHLNDIQQKSCNDEFFD